MKINFETIAAFFLRFLRINNVFNTEMIRHYPLEALEIITLIERYDVLSYDDRRFIKRAKQYLLTADKYLIKQHTKKHNAAWLSVYIEQNKS
jgi:hypothetical protein